MGHVITLSDEQYETITRAAAQQGTTPDAVLAQLIEGLRDPYTQPRYYSTEDFLRHLGASDEEIAELEREVADDAESKRGTDADA